MGSRIRDNPSTLIECFCEVVIPGTCSENAWILQKFPESYGDTEMLKSVPEFAYPCEFSNVAVQHFSFVLTSMDSKWTFGFCRHAPNSPTCLVLLSYLPWHETFYKVLNEIAELTNKKDSGLLGQFLEALYGIPIPDPGFQLRIAYGPDRLFQCSCSDHTKLPSIPENRNLTEYYNAVDATNMVVIFASMLHERRILITSKHLSRLSACVQAANALIYPMEWQHIFIPVLPNHLLDYLSAPMPFLIGVPKSTLSRVSRSELGEMVVLDADNNKVDSPFDDVQTMPSDIVSSLKRSLRNRASLVLGEGVSQAFLRTLVHLMGGYRGALQFQPGQKITFDPQTFLQTRPQNLRPFLEKMLQLQIFQQFIEGRLLILNAGKVNNDIFELEVNIFDDSSSKQFKRHYKHWLVNMKKEGGALLKTMKSKANPAVRSAYKNVKDKGRRAYSNIQVKITGLQRGTQDDMALPARECSQPRSAPTSPVTERRPPVTFRRIPPCPGKNGGNMAVWRTASLENSTVKSAPSTDVEVGLDAVSEMADENSSTSSFQGVDLDLMGEIEEIFSKCSTGDSPRREERADERTSAREKSVPLPPPPRGRRRTSAPPSAPTTDAPLIRLESQEEEDEPLDPLLRSTPVRPTVAPPPPPARAPPLLPVRPDPFAPRAPPTFTTFRQQYGPVPYRPPSQSAFGPVGFVGSARLSANPFVPPTWVVPQTSPLSQQAPVQPRKDPCADLIDL